MKEQPVPTGVKIISILLILIFFFILAYQEKLLNRRYPKNQMVVHARTTMNAKAAYAIMEFAQP